ncbi:putative ribonuclease H-like domain-containing protein [Tanacetum coccineum]
MEDRIMNLTTKKKSMTGRNEMKARGNFVDGTPYKDQLKFHSIKMQNSPPSWKSLRRGYGWETRNQESQRTLLKLQYENFTTDLAGVGCNGQALVDKSKVEVLHCHKNGHFARECEAPSESGNAEEREIKKDYNSELHENALLLNSSSLDSEVDSCSKSCVKAYATLKEQYDSLSSDYKKSQFNLVSYKAVESFVNSSEMLENQENNKSKSDKGYHAVPLPFTGNFIPRKPDLTFMDEIVESENIGVIIVVTPSNVKNVESNHGSACVKNNGDAIRTLNIRLNSFLNLQSLKIDFLGILLATKDETSGILKTFITEIENQLDYKVKVIRSDNGTEFKNSNGVAERRNRTLIEAARTMLVDSKLPTTFWAEAVNTACYVLNRVLVIKPHNKTPYELIRGRTPLIDFMKPFGCPVTILNTRDHLGKFDGKADEGFFVGYSVFPDKVYKVEKALYGLHQAPRAWYETLSTYLIKNGFRRGTIDKTLFIKKDKGDILLVQVYVDDIIFGSTKKSLCDEFEGLMHKRFQMSSMGELTFFLGLQVQQKEDGIFISQDKYVAEILKKFDFATVKTTSTPMEPNKALVKDEEADSSKDSPFDLEAFLDSDYAGASLDRKSTTGGCQFLGKRLISWQCKKQTIVANSTTKAEYVAAANCCRQVFKDGFDGCIGLKMLFGPVLRVKHGKKLVSAARLTLCCWAKVSTVRHRVSAARQT